MLATSTHLWFHGDSLDQHIHKGVNTTNILHLFLNTSPASRDTVKRTKKGRFFKISVFRFVFSWIGLDWIGLVLFCFVLFVMYAIAA